MNTFKIVIAAALLSATQAQAEPVDRTIAVDPRGEVEIVNVAGSIRVTGWERNEVQVRGNLGRNVERLELQRDGNHTLVKVILPFRGSSSDSDLEIRIPRDSSIETNTVSATQTINDVRGAQRLQSVSGEIETQAWSGEFQAKSVSGNITVKGQSKDKNTAGQIRLSTVSGDLEVDNLSGELELRTVNGNMRVSDLQLTRAHIRTTNGDLQLSATLARDAKIDTQAVNGDLRFKFDGAINAEFDIETFNGDIDNCFGPKPKQIHEHGPGTQLRFKEGEGSAHVRIKTLNGAVDICGK